MVVGGLVVLRVVVVMDHVSSLSSAMVRRVVVVLGFVSEWRLRFLEGFLVGGSAFR